MAEFNLESFIASNDRPVYTVREVGNREILFSLSTGGTKAFSKSWLKKMVTEGSATVKGNILTFTGSVEREF